MSKPAELRDQTDEQLELLLKDVQNNLFRLRLQSETERLEAPSEIIKAKREIARIKTILRLREIERERSVAAPAAADALSRSCRIPQTGPILHRISSQPQDSTMSPESTASTQSRRQPAPAARRRSGSWRPTR